MSAATSPYADLAAQVNSAMDELSADTSVYVPDQPAVELFRLDDKVQIFFVTADGRVSTFSAPESLRIFQFDDGKSANENNGANSTEENAKRSNVFLQVGGWTHPLVPGASPCLQAENGAFMFPDIYSEVPNSAVGLVLLDDVQSEVRTELIALLQKYTAFKAEKQVADHQLGPLGSALVKGAELLSKGIEFGSEKAGHLIEYATEKTQKKMEQCEAPDAKVGALTKHTVRAAKHTTNATVKVSGFVANRVGKLTKSLADYLAAKAEKPLTGTVSTVGGKKDQGAMAYLIDAARGGLVAYGTVYSNLEANAKVLGNQLKNNSVKIVQHKYGAEAGDVFGEAMTAAGNGAMTYMNIQSLGVKGLIKKTAKETGKTVAVNVINNSAQQPPNKVQKME